MIIPISDPSDDRIAAYRDLNKTHVARQAGLFIAEGRWLVERLLSSDLATRSVLTSEHYLAEMEQITPVDIPIYSVPQKMVDQIIGFKFHRGILACGERPENTRLLRIIGRSPLNSTIVVCSEIVDPVNLGGIIRNCSAFGVSGLLVDAHAADPYSRRAVRVSMGTAFRLPIRVSRDLLHDLSELKKEHGFDVAVTVLADDAERLELAQRPARLALIFGGEGHGLSDELTRLADRRLTVPMSLETDSLNVASSAAVFLYHFMRITDEYR